MHQKHCGLSSSLEATTDILMSIFQLAILGLAILPWFLSMRHYVSVALVVSWCLSQAGVV